VGAFLLAVSSLYELHIYTMGDKGYAALMADVLDPQHRLFVGRVISAVRCWRVRLWVWVCVCGGCAGCQPRPWC
jgi:hypothetical protein